jgi:quinol monooxygenase YgiN
LQRSIQHEIGAVQKEVIAVLNNESDAIQRREFLRGLMLAAPMGMISAYSNGQLRNDMANKYGLYGKLQAKTGKGTELGSLLLKAAAQMENVKGCVLYFVGKTAENPEGVYVIEVWESKEDHDNSLKLPAARELISQAMPILEGKPEGTTLEILGGKGIS